MPHLRVNCWTTLEMEKILYMAYAILQVWKTKQRTCMTIPETSRSQGATWKLKLLFEILRALKYYTLGQFDAGGPFPSNAMLPCL